MKKRILIDATTISRRIDGLSQYILNVVLNMDATLADYTMLVRPGQCPPAYYNMFVEKGIKIEEADISPIGPKRDIQYKRWLKNNESRFDAAFCPSNQFPVALNIPCLYTVHDLIYEEFPEQLGRLRITKRRYLHWNVAQGLKKAKKIVAVSKYTKSEILRYHKKAKAGKISVIYEGWEHLKLIEHTDYNPAFEKYILYVGSSRGHKNLSRLIDAMILLQDKLPQEWGLIIAGNDKMFTKHQKEKIAKANLKREIVHLTGWLTEEDLAGCMKKADLLIFPSLSEGFGIPVLEAYYYQIPLLLADKASLPEVAGNAAIYFDPTKAQDMADKIMYAISEDHSELIEKQNTRLKRYSWQKTAKEIEELLLKL